MDQNNKNRSLSIACIGFGFIALLFFVVIFISNQNVAKYKKETIDYMLTSIESKYNQTFTYVDITIARGRTYSNIMTLNYNDIYFNVYSDYEKTYISDNLLNVIVSDKVSNDYIKEQYKFDNDVKIYTHLWYELSENFSFEDVKRLSSNDIVNSLELLKAIVVIKTKDDAYKIKDKLYDIYLKTITLNPKHIDFVVITARDDNVKLNNMLNNIPGKYDDDWKKYGVTKFKHTTKLNVQSSDELIN